MLRYNLLTTIAFLFVLNACKVAAPVRLPASVPPPGTFTGNTDSTSIGDLAWRDFFTDPNLVSLIDTAVRNNLDLKIAVQRVEAAQASFRLSRGALFPSLNLVASAGADRFGDYTMNGVGNFDSNLSPNVTDDRRIPTRPTPDYFLGFRSNWEIDIWGRLRKLRRAAYYRYLASEQGKRVVTTALVAEVARLYYELLALDYERDIIVKNIRLQEVAVETITAQKMGGRATELAVQQSTAQLLRTRSLEARIRQAVVFTENQLNLLLGRFPQRIERRRTLPQQTFPEQVRAGVPAHLLRRRPDIRQAELALEATKADVDAARAAFLPALTITPYAGFNAFNTGFLFNPGSFVYGALAGLTAPVFSRNVLRSSYRIATAEARSAFYAYQRSVLSGHQEVVTSLQAIQNLQVAYDLRQQEVDVLEKAVSTANDLYVTGYASYLEVVTAQRSVLEAELDLAITRRDQFFTLLDLYRSLGGGWQ